MGLVSEGDRGVFFLESGRMNARFQLRGNTAESIQRLKKFATTMAVT